MSESKNEFYKGLDMDTSPLKTGMDTLRDALNIRLIDNQGNGLCAININGNDYRFQLKEFYVPLGYCVYNNIAYIFSVSSIGGPGVTGQPGEIGCYPAPNGTGGFLSDINGNPVYKALQNWTGSSVSGPMQDFNTLLLNFDDAHQIDCFARIDYDNSVNIYWADNKNMFRCVNSGFNQEGVYNNRTYYTGNFNQINVFAESVSPPVITGMTESLGGALQTGNYFFFLRYSTADFQKTSFLCQSWAVQVSLEATDEMEIDGAPGGTVSQKQVTFNVGNLDPSYTYFEVAVVYYNQGTSSVYLINEEYNIAQTIVSGKFSITGNEEQLTFTMADIQRRKSSTSVPKTCTQLENRAWLGNVSENNPLTAAQIAFANAIKISHDDSLRIPDKPFATTDTFANGGQYKDNENTYNNVGYFRGETYPFGIVFVYTDGTESESIPCKGFDDWTIPYTTAQANTNGIYRFPNSKNSPFRIGSDFTNGTGQLSIMGVKFDWTGLTIPIGIIGWYFVRGERTANLVYQGISLPTFNSKGCWTGNMYNLLHGQLNTLFPNPGQGVSSQNYNQAVPANLGNGYSIPLFDSYIPFNLDTNPLVGARNTCNRIFTNFPNPNNLIVNEDTTRKGFYSPDLLFEQDFQDAAYTIYKLGDVYVTGMNVVNMTDQSGYFGLDFMFECLVIDFSSYLPVSVQMQCNNVQGFSISNINGFVAQFVGGQQTEPNCFYYNEDENIIFGNKDILSNRNIATNIYIGITNQANNQLNWTSGQAAYPSYGKYPLVNIYGTNPEPPVSGGTYNITTLYVPYNVTYFKISDFIALSQNPTNQTCYNGDCFLQRTYMKQSYNLDDITSDGNRDTLGGVYAAHGTIFSIVTENNTNTAMRIGTLQNFYYPGSQSSLNATLNDTAYQSVASGANTPESNTTNAGYNQVLSGFFYGGFDPQIPFLETQYETRIMYSEFHPNGSFTDFYRIFDVAAYQDYDYRLGYIVRILDFHSRLVSVQQSGINFHLVNERAMLNTATAGQLLIGTGDVLSPKAQVISDVYGSQHEWSIVKTDYNIYGLDYNKRLIWRVKADGTFENISTLKKVDKWITNVFVPFMNPESTIKNVFPDNPVGIGGIVGAYDRKYQDVIFTVTNGQAPTTNNDTICFNELLDEFTTRYGYNSPFYLTLNNDFFSVNPFVAIQTPFEFTIGQGFYVHDAGTTVLGANNVQTFYGVLEKSFVQFIHNEGSDVEKIYEHLEISSNGNEFSNIIYTTEEQQSDNLTFRQPNALYIDPRFRENFWLVPVPRATVISPTMNNPDSIESVMRGKYMMVYLEYNNNTMQYIKSVLTFFRVSY